MSKKPSPIDKPTRRTVEMLFRDLLSRDRECPEYAAYEAARHAENELEERLKDNKQLKALRRKREAAWSKYNDRERKVRAAAQEVRTLYLAKGLTPSVQKAIDNLLVKVKS